jgi:hypothetical protein
MKSASIGGILAGLLVVAGLVAALIAPTPTPPPPRQQAAAVMHVEAGQIQLAACKGENYFGPSKLNWNDAQFYSIGLDSCHTKALVLFIGQGINVSYLASILIGWLGQDNNATNRAAMIAVAATFGGIGNNFLAYCNRDGNGIRIYSPILHCDAQ